MWSLYQETLIISKDTKYMICRKYFILFPMVFNSNDSKNKDTIKYKFISLHLTLVSSFQFNNFGRTDISNPNSLFKVYVLQICYYSIYLAKYWLFKNNFWNTFSLHCIIIKFYKMIFAINDATKKKLLKRIIPFGLLVKVVYYKMAWLYF